MPKPSDFLPYPPWRGPPVPRGWFQSHSSIGIQPTSKVRTIHYDDFKIDFGPHGGELETGELRRHPEYGTSMSLDGCYLDYPYFKPGLSLLFPLEPSIDLPKFYLNPFGQLVSRGYMLDSPTFIRECEVKYPGTLYTRNCTGVVIHIGHKKIDEDLERARERWAKPSPETPPEFRERYARELTERSEWYANEAHRVISYVEQHFRILPEVPVTDFRLMAQRVTPRIYDCKYSPSMKADEVSWRVWFDSLVEVSGPYHEAVARAYNLSYPSITDFAWQHIEFMLRK